ncbi:hypothetical protein [Roseovarius dicentrarchi]|uniref:hypothetical protein n=1 Tax=Roseovarius dicentrarchi TaxID=2250573 RepID=UPI000DEB54AE|nr:hypothetical protein [Roseovarius dicentrarchi]
MRFALAFAALIATGACGVDGAPVRPVEADRAPGGRKATVKPDTGDWITGTASMHTAATL